MDLTVNRNGVAAEGAGGMLNKAIAGVKTAGRALEFLSPVLDLAIRLLIASVFFKSGLTKIESWESTLSLFENEYAVPLLAPALAAYLGTTAELGLPILLALGIGTRFSALALFVFNIIATISYPDLSEVGLKDHQYW
ncbi:MAG TPA: DoxX family protein, partial [Burkholderiales bacterium]|nr:DoxX family protein [Burkholderiales bacterium]